MPCLMTWTGAASKPLALVSMAHVCWLLKAGTSRRWLGDYTQGQGCQHRNDNERASLVYAGLGRLFRLLRNTRSAHRPHSLGPAATPVRSVAAVEDTTSSPCGADCTGSEGAAGEQYRRQRSWSLASCQEQGPLRRTQQQVLQIARSSISIWRVLAKLLEPPR